MSIRDIKTWRWPRLLPAVLALACVAPAVQATERDDDDDEPRDRGFCSATAQLLQRACGAEARDDQLVAKAKCINIGDARDRAQCLADIRQGRSEALQACRARLEGRRAACALLG